MTTVPNVFPTSHNASYRIAVIGEAPGKDEIEQGEPFVGQSGRLLNQLLSNVGLVRQALFIGNVCQHRPPNNDIEEFQWGGQEVQSGLNNLFCDLEQFKPNLCLLLGSTALRAFKDEEASLTYYRGSVFRGHGGYKCLATYHPAAILRQYDWLQVLALDLQRAAQEGRHTNIVVPERYLLVPPPSFEWVIERLFEIELRETPISIDIEGGTTGMHCISIATSATHSFIIPFSTTNGFSYWSEYEEDRIWASLSRVLANPKVPKILQNSLYDNFVLSYTYQCPIVNVRDDTMFKHWECYCELPKSLGFMASIYTSQPPWKDDRKTPDLETYWKYCCTDSAVTYEINDVLTSELADSLASQQHYGFNLQLLYPLLYMELRGFRFDVEKAKDKCEKLDTEIASLNQRLSTLYNDGEELNLKSTVQ